MQEQRKVSGRDGQSSTSLSGLKAEETTDTVDLERLKKLEPILFYAQVITVRPVEERLSLLMSIKLFNL